MQEIKTYHKIQSVFKRDPATNHKTFLEGIWSLPEFGYLRNCLWAFDEKVDGTNIRIMGSGELTLIAGRNEKSDIPIELMNAIYKLLPAGKLASYFSHEDFCLYGEGYGAGIQKGGGNYRPDAGFVLFDIRMGDWWLKREDVRQIAEGLGIQCVPSMGQGTLWDMLTICQRGFSSRWGDFRAEGIVARPAIDLQTRGGHRIITKLKCKDFDHAEKRE